MSIRVRVLNRDVTPEEVEIEIKQSSVGDISCVIPMFPFMGSYDNGREFRQALKFSSIEIYHHDRLLRSGIIKDALPASLGKADGYVQLKCEDEFGRLTATWSKPDAHYQDNAIVDILDDLLSIASGWSQGDNSTMVDDTVTTTVNLRSKNRLWAQLVEMVESKPEIFLRYGGVDGITGDHLVDIGLFAEEDDSRYAIEGQNVFGIKQKITPNDLVRRIRPKGGKSGETIIKLTGFEVDLPDFPIELDVATGEYYVRNANLPAGADVSITYNHIKTENSGPPSSSQLVECRQALYDATVRDLQLGDEREVLTVDLELPVLPKVGQNIYIRSKVDVEAYDLITESYISTNVRYIDGYYRITKIKLKYKKTIGLFTEIDALTDWVDNDWIVCELEVTDGLDLSKYNTSEYLARQMTRDDDSDEPFGAGLGLGGSYVQTVNHNTVANDCTTGGLNGKLFEFPFDPPLSPNINTVTYEVISLDPDTCVYTVNQEPSLSDPLILCVSGDGPSHWNVSDDVDVTIRYTYNT